MPEVELTFKFEPPADVRSSIGPAKCTLWVSTAPLSRDDNTVAVLCHAYLHATTLAGRNREALVEYVFGEVEVPSLDDDPGPIPAFDNTRNLSLNPQNPKVRALEAWLGACIDEVLKKLAEREKRRQQAREQHLLRRMATEIKSFLDEDFLAIQGAMPWASMPGVRKRADREPDTRAPGATRHAAHKAAPGRDRARDRLGTQPAGITERCCVSSPAPRGGGGVRDPLHAPGSGCAARAVCDQ